jgi:hypothetical protein
MMTESELALCPSKVTDDAISAESGRVIAECEDLVKLHRMTLRDDARLEARLGCCPAPSTSFRRRRAGSQWDALASYLAAR